MQYLLMIARDESVIQNISEEERERITAAFAAYTEALKQAGIHMAGARLHPTSTAATVRIREGKTEVLSGPYAETREQLGGYYLIDVPDQDTALSWAARCPGASFGTVEVRPIWPMC